MAGSKVKENKNHRRRLAKKQKKQEVSHNRRLYDKTTDQVQGSVEPAPQTAKDSSPSASSPVQVKDEPKGDGLVDLVNRRVPDGNLPRPEAARNPVIVSCAAKVENQ